MCALCRSDCHLIQYHGKQIHYFLERWYLTARLDFALHRLWLQHALLDM